MCGDDRKKWEEAEEATIQALRARDKFWSAIANEIDIRKGATSFVKQD